MKLIRCSLLLIFVVFCIAAKAQLNILPKYELGIDVGGYMYQGDLTTHRFGSIETIKPGISLSATRIINPSFSARLQFNIASLKADESIYKTPDWRQQRNLKFTTPLKELSLSVNWNILGNNYTERKFEPYLFAGIGISFIKVARDTANFNVAYFGAESDVLNGLAQDLATAPPRTIAVVPAGAGVRYNISQRVALHVETTYQFMNTDYLDGFSKVANPKLNDHYTSINIGAILKLGKKDKYACPVNK